MFVATIILVAILTALIFTLTIVAFSAVHKSEKREIELGNMDTEIKKDIEKEKKKSFKALNIIGSIIGGFVALSLLLASITAITYKAQGEQFAINNQVSLVIVSDSMNGFYNEKYEIELLEQKEDAAKDQFQIGDLLTFEKVTEQDDLILFDVYGYKNSKGLTITHRLIGTTEEGKLIFRGDNTGGRDSYVDRSQVVLHYSDFKVPKVGMFILFSQSGFGLYAFISVICVYVLAEVYGSKYDKLIKNRIKYLSEPKADVAEDEKVDVKTETEDHSNNDEALEKPTPKPVIEQSQGRLVEFTTKQGRKVKFYVKPKGGKKDEK